MVGVVANTACLSWFVLAGTSCVRDADVQVEKEWPEGERSAFSWIRGARGADLSQELFVGLALLHLHDCCQRLTRLLTV
jgi:hypothetical protein